MCAYAHRARAFVAAISLFLISFYTNASAEQFVLGPSRVVGPHATGQVAPAPSGGWQAGDDRSLNASVVGQGGWTGTCSNQNYDQEITAGIAHSGGHGWRLSNWYHDGCVNHVISAPYSPAGEIGSTTAYNVGGVGPTTNSVVYEFWFRSASVQPDPGVFTSTTITDQQGRRMTYLGFFDEPAGPGGQAGNGCPTNEGCFHLDASGVTDGGTPGDDNTVVFDDNYSPALERGRWYRVHIDATFNDTIGESTRRNDVVDYVLYDSAGNKVWSALGINTWEDAYYEGHYGSNLGDKVASNYIAYRISANPDTGDQSDGDTYSVVNRPHGIVFDDLNVVPGDAKPGFSTSFDFDRYVATNGTDNSTCVDKLNPCLTIAYAITQSNPYDTIHVAAGTYVERTNATTNLTITKPIAIEGAQVGIDARTRSDAGATIIVPGVAESGLNYGSTNTAVVNIASNGVSLDGLIIDTDNPSITTGLGLNGTDPDVSSAVFAAGNNITIQNTVLRNAIFAGIYADNTDNNHVNTPGGDSLIQLNRFTNITNPSTWGIGVYAGDNFYAQITDNLLDQVRVGIQFAENDYAADPGTQMPAVSRNEIHATRTGMFFNLFYANATTWTVSDNHVFASANTGQANEWNGMQIESMQSDQTANISGNVIDGSAVLGSRHAVGYVLNNIVSTRSANTAIDGGSVSNVDVGVLSTDATNYTGPVNGFLVRNVAFNGVSLAAFYVEDTDQIAGSATLNIGAGNTFTSVAHQLALSGANPGVSFNGVGGVNDVLVRAGGNYFFTVANANSCSTVCTTSNASINTSLAAAAANGTIYLENTTFNEGVVIGTGKDGVRLTASDQGNPPTLTRSTGGPNQPVLVIAGTSSNAPKNVTVDHLHFLVDKVHAGEGLLASGFVDGLTIDSNTFTQIASASSGFAKYSFTNAIAVNIDPQHNSAALPRVDGSRVTITNNTISGSTSPNATQFRAGMAVDASVGLISGNHSSGLNHDAIVRFATHVSGGSNGWMISGNVFTGGGLEFDAPNAGIVPITIDSNTIVSESTPPALLALALTTSQQNVEADFSAFRLIDNFQNLPITVSNNTISGYANGLRGALVENFPNATFVNNTFSPLAGAGDFASLVVSNREINTDNPPEHPYPMVFTALQNKFNDSGIAGAGRAVELINDNDANGTAVFDAIKFGSTQASDANVFGDGHQYYFNLVDQNCDTNLAAVGSTPGGVSPQCTFLDYNAVNSPGGLPNTQARPFRANVYAVNNLFAGLMPHAMSPVQQAALNQQTFDINDDVSLGLVNYGFNGAVDINLQGPVANVQVGVATDYSAELTNTGNALSENVLIQFSINRTAGISAGDMVLQYYNGSSYQAIPLTTCAAGLCGTFGPQPGGFPVSTAYDAVTKLLSTFAVADTYTVNVQLQGVSSNVIYASDTLSTQVVLVAAKIGLALSGPQTASVGSAVGGYAPRVTNTGGPAAENVLMHFVVARNKGIGAGDTTLQYFDGTTYQSIPLAVCPQGLCGTFGPQPGGFPIGPGFDQTMPLQAIYAKSDVFTIAASVDGVITATQYASSSLQVTVEPGLATNIAPNSSTSITGTAGTLAAPLPSVVVTDSLGNPVAGYPITFVAGANSGTLSGAAQITNANGVATVGGWTLGTNTTETVTVTTPLNGSPVTFTATVSAQFDMAVSITDRRDYAQYGSTLDYAIVVSNGGPSTASKLVTDNLPPELNVAGATWVCLAHTTNATCTASGTGNLSDTPTIPSGGSVTYFISTNVLAVTPDETIVDQVTVDSTGDSDPTNNTATSTTTIVIFRDGFETGSGSGTTDAVRTVGSLDENSTLALDPNTAPQAASSPVVWMRAVDAQQREAFRIEVIHGSDGTLVRVVTRNASGVESHSAWTALKSAAVGVTGKSGAYDAMLVVSGGGGLEVAIPAWAVLPLSVQAE